MSHSTPAILVSEEANLSNATPAVSGSLQCVAGRGGGLKYALPCTHCSMIGVHRAGDQRLALQRLLYQGPQSREPQGPSRHLWWRCWW